MINRIIGVSWHNEKIVSHFGINPVNGGIPLNDKSITGNINCITGFIEFILLNCLLLDCRLNLSIKNKGVIIKQYKI